MVRRICVVDDAPDLCALVRRGLVPRGYDVLAATTGESALELLRHEDLDAVVTEVKLPHMSGFTLCEWVAANRPDTPVIVVTAVGSVQAAVSAMRVGAADFISKPVDIAALALAVDRVVGRRTIGQEVRRLRRVAQQSDRFGDMVGQSRAMRRVYDLVGRLDASDATVLITGESGTGKELVARALHRRSARQKRPFVAINCAAMPANLLESQLFGHVRGAFTDAKMAHEGLLVQADGGTLLLDEIGEMPAEMQAKLLRALQEARVRPVGANHEVAFDARIVAATNRDLEADIEEGRFREDLFYRINVIHLHVPPLRARGRDVLLLAQHFLDRVSTRLAKDVGGLSVAAAEKLLSYDWPGNVRELENCIERAATLARFEKIMLEDLPERVRGFRSSQLVIESEDPKALVTLEELERRHIRRVLQAMGGNKSQAARVLGLDRRTLYRKLDRLERGLRDEGGPSAPADPCIR